MERVAVYTRTNDLKYVTWLGLIERSHAIELGEKCKSVRLAISSYAFETEEFGREWVEIDNGQSLQGCYVHSLEGVFAVIDEGQPRIVKPKYSMAGAHNGKY